MPPEGLKPYLQRRRRLVAGAVLVAGLAAGLLIYVTAPPPAQNPLGNEAEQSKQYLREMETYGGTANVLASEIREWFDSLWHPPILGVTVACLSAALAAAIFLALTPLSAGAEPTRRD